MSSEKKNMEKYEIYRSMMINLTKAVKSEFYYQAIFIEYAIIEDRCASVLKHANVKCIDSKGNEIKLSDKLKKMESNPAFVTPYVRARITLDLLSEITQWKRNRDELMHALAKIPYDYQAVKDIALEGQRIVRILDNKVKSVNTYYNKKQ